MGKARGSEDARPQGGVGTALQPAEPKSLHFSPENSLNSGRKCQKSRNRLISPQNLRDSGLDGEGSQHGDAWPGAAPPSLSAPPPPPETPPLTSSYRRALTQPGGGRPCGDPHPAAAPGQCGAARGRRGLWGRRWGCAGAEGWGYGDGPHDAHGPPSVHRCGAERSGAAERSGPSGAAGVGVGGGGWSGAGGGGGCREGIGPGWGWGGTKRGERGGWGGVGPAALSPCTPTSPIPVPMDHGILHPSSHGPQPPASHRPGAHAPKHPSARAPQQHPVPQQPCTPASCVLHPCAPTTCIPAS